MPEMSILKSVRESFNQKDIFLMRNLIERMYETRPYDGMSIFYNAHLTLSSILQIEAICASGAKITVTSKPELRQDPNTIEILKKANIEVVPIELIKDGVFDVAIDCSAGILDTKASVKYGVSELTQTGVVKYKANDLAYPVISVDDSEVKRLETYLGTGDGFVRGFHKLTKSGIRNKKFVVIGYGKVGHGIVKALSYFTDKIAIIDNDSAKVRRNEIKGYHIYDISSDREQVVQVLKDAYCVVTATGVKDLVSRYFDRGIIGAKYLANMGSEDEWGSKFFEHEILNNKLALNFCLDYPTQLKLLDPIFYAQLSAIDVLLKGGLSNTVHNLPADAQLPIITQWALNHNAMDVGGDYLEQILNNIPGFIYWKDRDSVYQGCNSSFASVAGLATSKEIIGKTDYELPWKETEAEVYRRGDQSAFEGNSLINVEETQLQADGRQKTVLASKIPFCDNEGNIVGVLGIYSDITDTKEKERLLLENQIHVATANEQLKFRNIVGQVIHDIQSPLSSLRTILESTKEIPERKRIALRIAAVNISDITRQLLNHYRFNHDDSESARQNVLVSSVLAEVFGDRSYHYRSKAIRFEFQISLLNAFLFIKASQPILKRAMINLLNNAVEAVAGIENPKIELQLKGNNEWVFIRILDNGCGIPDEVIKKIKESIAVSHGKKDGHGIGLGQVRDMLDKNYGKFDIISSTNQLSHGTTVTLSFPRVISPEWICEKVALHKNDVILILDDDESIHTSWETRLEHILEKTPEVTIRHFYTGEEIIKFVKDSSKNEKERFYLLSDYELINQGLNGIEVIKACAVKRSILVTSLYADSKLQTVALKNKIKILPKDLVFTVPIAVEASENEEIYDVHMVFVDDDKYFTSTLIAEHFNNFLAHTYTNPEHFLEVANKYQRDTRIILDNYYYVNDEPCALDGLMLAEKLHQMGFTKLVLLSGEEFAVPDYLHLVLKSDLTTIKHLDSL